MVSNVRHVQLVKVYPCIYEKISSASFSFSPQSTASTRRGSDTKSHHRLSRAMEPLQPETPRVSEPIHVLPEGPSTSIWAPIDQSEVEELQHDRSIKPGSPSFGTSTGGMHEISRRGRTFDSSYQGRIPVSADSFGRVTKEPEAINLRGTKLYAKGADGQIHARLLSPAPRPNFRKKLPLSRTPYVSSGSEEARPESPCSLTSNRTNGLELKSNHIQARTSHDEKIFQGRNESQRELDRTISHRHRRKGLEVVSASNDLTNINAARVLHRKPRISNMFAAGNPMGITNNIRETFSKIKAKFQSSKAQRIVPQYLSPIFESSRKNNELRTKAIASGNLYGKLESLYSTYDLTWELMQAAYLTPDSPWDLWENPRRAPKPPRMP